MTDANQQNHQSSRRLRWILRKVRHLLKQYKQSTKSQRGRRIQRRIATLYSILSVYVVPSTGETRKP